MALLVFGGGGLYCLYAAVGRFFPVQEVVLRGGDGALRQPLESLISDSVPRGTSLLLFDGQPLTRRLEAETWVAHARLRRRLPGTLIVELVQREPLAILKQGETSWVCDREGIIVEVHSPSDGLEPNHQQIGELPLVEVEGLIPSRLAVGRRVADEWFGTALEAISFLRAVGAETPGKVYLSSRRGMEIELMRGTRLRLGPPVHVTQKLQVCLRILDTYPEDRRLSLVDVSCPDYSYYELAPW